MEGIKMTKIERNKNDMNGSHLVGQIKTTYKNLYDKFGHPHFVASDFGDGKIDVEWSLKFPWTSDVCTIYNWKNGKNYLGDKGQEVENITNWNIGGYNSKVVPMIKEVINK